MFTFRSEVTLKSFKPVAFISGGFSHACSQPWKHIVIYFCLIAQIKVTGTCRVDFTSSVCARVICCWGPSLKVTSVSGTDKWRLNPMLPSFGTPPESPAQGNDVIPTWEGGKWGMRKQNLTHFFYVYVKKNTSKKWVDFKTFKNVYLSLQQSVVSPSFTV